MHWLRGVYVFDGAWAEALPSATTMKGKGKKVKRKKKGRDHAVVGSDDISASAEPDGARELLVLKPAFEWPKPLGVRANPRADSARTGQRVPVGIQSRQRVSFC